MRAHENDWVTKDGSRRRIVWDYTFFLDTNSTIKYVIANGSDITQRQHTEAELTGEITEIRASGDFARSQSWLQIMANLVGYEVLKPEVHEGSGFGAAVLAMHAVGAIPDLSDVQKLVGISHRYQPDSHLSGLYRDLFSIYERIYQDLVEEFPLLADYQRQLG